MSHLYSSRHSAMRELRRYDRNQWLLKWARIIGWQLFGFFLLACAASQMVQFLVWFLSPA